MYSADGFYPSHQKEREVRISVRNAAETIEISCGGLHVAGKNGRKEFCRGLQSFQSPRARVAYTYKGMPPVPTELTLRHEAKALDFSFPTYFCFPFAQHKQIKLP